MSDIKLRSDIRVELLRHTGSDSDIARAAWVSAPEDHRGYCEEGTVGKVIQAMMKGRHGSPFEHGSLTFYIEAPIFVFREWHRHRIGWSFNETSARYKVMKPEFYVPPRHRPCVEPGGFKPMRPVLDRHEDSTDWLGMMGEMEDAYEACWQTYTKLIGLRVAREVARSVLPVGVYSSMHTTCNPRSLMHFLSLRTTSDDATVKSYPQWEIEQAANHMEGVFEQLWPLTYKAFVTNGRVAP